jgi:hypothetical protein
MAEFITGLIVLPALYLVGDFYCRAGRRLWRKCKHETSGNDAAGDAESVTGEGRYDLALATASAIVVELKNRPEMSQAETLSTLTFAILRAMHQAEMPLPAGSAAKRA